MTTYNQWWVDNIPYVETQEHNIDKTVFYRWWLSRFNMLDANMPGNTFQYPTSIEGVLGYNNQIVLTSGMFINDTKWFRNAEYSYGTWVSAGQTAKKGQSGYYYYHDNPGDPANWNHSYTQYITKAGWDSYKVHGGPSSLAEALGDYGSEDVKGLLNSQSERMRARSAKGVSGRKRRVGESIAFVAALVCAALRFVCCLKGAPHELGRHPAY